MREVQQKPSWKELSGGGGASAAVAPGPAPGPAPRPPGQPANEPAALHTVQTYIMLEQRRKADFSIDSILKFNH